MTSSNKCPIIEITEGAGRNAETVEAIKAYKPETNSISSGQVLTEPYTFDKTRIVVREMTDLLSLDLVRKGLVTNQIVLTIGYDIENLANPEISKYYSGEVTTDHYGRRIPKHAHGTQNLAKYTSSTKLIVDAAMELFDRIANPKLLVRRITVVACKVIPESEAEAENFCEQLDFFSDYDKIERDEEAERKEKNIQEAILRMKERFGKNAVLRGMNLQEGATTISRNGQIGGHKA